MTLFGEKIGKHVTLRQAVAGTYDIPADAAMTDQLGTEPMANSPYFSPDKPSRTVTSVGMRAIPMTVMFDKRTMKEKPAATYDEQLYRSLTLDELARLQSFPAGYRLVGKPADLVKGVANAVPPLMAHALAAEIARVESRRMQGGRA
jgi:site-specific DNA-cytosine methylase